MTQRKTRPKKLFVWMVMLLIVVVFGGLYALQTLGGQSAAQGDPMVGKAAPSFQLSSTQGLTGLKQFRGQNVVLYFYEGNS